MKDVDQIIIESAEAAIAASAAIVVSHNYEITT